MREALTDLVLLAALAAIAAGRVPRLRMNRATIALAAAALLVAMGSIGLAGAFAAIDMGTIVLLLSMMLIVANLRLSGFFEAAGAALLAAARGPRQLLALVVLAAGLLSALFLNDTICLMLTPLVVELCLRSKRDPLPYLVALATAANVGSAATIVGNPQNMLIGASSGIPFGRFLLMLGPPSLFGLLVVYAVVSRSFPAEFRAGERLAVPEGARTRSYKPLLRKSLGAALLMLVLLFAGVPAPLASLVAAALLLVTRRVNPERVFAEVDFSLLVFFAGLFVITKTVEGTGAFRFLVDRSMPLVTGGAAGSAGGSAAVGAGGAAGAAGGAALSLFALLTAFFSNLVSNVPTVMLFRPLVAWFPDAEKAWLVLAMASTYAGNLTLLGSVANLIVAEGAKRRGVELSFGKYLKAGLPITLLTVAIGTGWLLLV
ncbi:MAG: anion transporter [Spirochaetaceae bacterium]|nr:anion transporter [Spirochaetaceae bacterium]